MMTGTGKTRRAWVVVGLLWLVALLNYLDRQMIATMRDPVIESIPMSDRNFGLLTSGFLWVYGILSPFGGYLADRLGKSRVIVVSLLVWSVVTWFTGHAQTYHQLLLARALMGVSEACYIPVALALIADHHRGATRSLATGMHMSGVYAGLALGGVGGYIAESHYGWRAAFTWFGVFGICYAAAVAFGLKDLPPETQGPSRGNPDATGIKLTAVLRALAAERGFWILLGVNALVGTANWGIYGWLPTYLKEHFGMGLGAAGISATGYIQVASFTGVLIGGALADRWSRTNVRSRALIPALSFCVAGPFLFGSAVTDLLPVAIGSLIVFGLGRGMFDANHMPMLRQLVDERFSATAFGLLNLVSCTAGGVMTYAGGALKDSRIDLARVFQFSAVGLFLVGLLLFAVASRLGSAPRKHLPIENLVPDSHS